MSNKQTITRKIAWPMVIPQLVTQLILIVSAAVFINPEPIQAISIGLAVYLTYSFGSRWLLTRSHRQGLQLAHNRQYQSAIASYKASYRFFERYPWLDQYRALTMMTPSAFSYTEMALVNIAYCYVQLGDMSHAKDYYQQTLSRFPKNEIALSALKLLSTNEIP